MDKMVAERYRLMTPDRRMRIASSMFETARAIIESSLPLNLTRRERRLAFAKRLYAGELPDAALLAFAEWNGCHLVGKVLSGLGREAWLAASLRTTRVRFSQPAPLYYGVSPSRWGNETVNLDALRSNRRTPATMSHAASSQPTGVLSDDHIKLAATSRGK